MSLCVNFEGYLGRCRLEGLCWLWINRLCACRLVLITVFNRLLLSLDLIEGFLIFWVVAMNFGEGGWTWVAQV